MATTDPLRNVRTELDDIIGEKTSPTIVVELTNELEETLLGADTILEELTLTLYDKASGQIVNNVDAIDILNAGRGTVDSLGMLTLKLLPEDTPIIDTTKAKEQHAAFIRWTWDLGTKAGGHILFHTVYNFLKVP